VIPFENSSALKIVKVFSGRPCREVTAWAYGSSVASNKVRKPQACSLVPC
jgi:hypothetical protein